MCDCEWRAGNTGYVPLRDSKGKKKTSSWYRSTNSPHVWPLTAPVSYVSQWVCGSEELRRDRWESQDHHASVRASTHVAHTLTALSLSLSARGGSESETEREKTPGGFSLSTLREMVGGGCERLRGASPAAAAAAAAASGVSAVMPTRGKMSISTEEKFSLLVTFMCGGGGGGGGGLLGVWRTCSVGHKTTKSKYCS